MTTQNNPRRTLALVLALTLAVPMVAGRRAEAQAPPDCLSVMSNGVAGRLTIDLPSASRPN
jgi:hypothetical protein